MLKRTVDVLLSGCALLAALPIVAIAALLIKLDSPGPVFFSQRRLGLGGRLFRIWKLRTMRVGIEGPGFTLGDDFRVTRVGRCLRRSKLDELPQFWNVLVGDMSLVGPRPVLPELILGYEREFAPLLQVRPGLTDPATLKYCHEEECLLLVRDQNLYFKTVLMPEKVRLSAAYLHRANPAGDLRLLVETLLALAPRFCCPPFMRAWFVAGANPADSHPIRDKV